MSERKVLIPVKGGLGNQMFFYTFSLYMSRKGFVTKLVWFHYIFTKHHAGIELYNIFDLNAAKLPLDAKCYLLIGKLLRFPLLRRFVGKLVSMKYYRCKKYVQSTPYFYEDFYIESGDGSIFMDGFWQNYMYLSSMREELLEIFKFKLPQNNSSFEKCRNEIRDVNSISIHIRRGDYLDLQFSELNVLNSIDYYYRAIDLVSSRMSDIRFFIFTDDPQWAKKYFEGDNFIFVEGNKGNDAYLDMYLMSQCKSNIIANSTFSWWAAWLNNNSNKVVIAPSRWTTEIESSLLCPPDWIFLNV